MPRCFVFLLFLLSVLPAHASDSGFPNIIVILADDIGYGDLGCYGSTKIKTPNIDKLAQRGLRFTDAHSPAAVCTPTRYALLTGQYAWRHEPGSRILSGLAPLCIPTDRNTVPKMLKKAGYTTAVVGKWHLGLGDKETDYNSEIKPGPKEVGFDYSYIIPATGDRTPCVFVENGRVVNYDPKDPIKVSYTNKVGEEPTGKDNPDLLTVQKPSHGHDNTIINGISRIGFMTGGKAARWKDEEIADDITKKAVKFIGDHKAKPFFLYFSTHDAHVPRVPHPRFKGKSEHGLRGDCIMEFDWCVGEIMKTVDDLKLTKNTLIIVTSDNGGVMDDGYIDGTQNDKSGHKCNGNLRGFKGALYEGGHRVPFIASWPGVVPENKSSNQLVCHVDFLATFAGLLKQDLPTKADSVNVWSAYTDDALKEPIRPHLVHQTNGTAGLAIRAGDWKLIPETMKKKAILGPELYNLALDPNETKNVAKDNPDKVKELQALLEKIKK